MIQDMAIVTMEDEYELVCGLSFPVTLNDPPNADNARIFFEYLMDDYNFDWVTFNFFRAYVKFH